MDKIKNNMKIFLPNLIAVFIIFLLILIPTGYEDAVIYKGMERSKAKVIEADSSRIISTGLIQSGEQVCRLEIVNGIFKGEKVFGVNMLTGSLEEDKIFQEGDSALVLISYLEDEILSVSMVDHYRIDKSIFLIGVFVIVLILFAGRTGLSAVLSFIISILSIWKLVVPWFLKGVNPVFAGLGITIFLTVIIITLVYGFDRKSLAAVSGGVLGVIATAVLGVLFTNMFKIHGAVMPYSETLLYNGYGHLNLTQIFMAGIFIGASGAIMDLAVDITSSVGEVVDKKPDITWQEAVKSGFTVGKAAMGTMTTTLLLAYSGGYLALLMVFMAQGTPIYNILNYKYVSAEILDTIIGSFGLVTVAPFTAITSGILLTGKKRNQ